MRCGKHAKSIQRQRFPANLQIDGPRPRAESHRADDGARGGVANNHVRLGARENARAPFDRVERVLLVCVEDLGFPMDEASVVDMELSVANGGARGCSVLRRPWLWAAHDSYNQVGVFLISRKGGGLTAEWKSRCSRQRKQMFEVSDERGSYGIPCHLLSLLVLHFYSKIGIDVGL